MYFKEAVAAMDDFRNKDLIIFCITDASNVYSRVPSTNDLNQGSSILSSFSLELQEH